MVPSKFQCNTLLEFRRFGVPNYYPVSHISKQHPARVNISQTTNFICTATKQFYYLPIFIVLKKFSDDILRPQYLESNPPWSRTSRKNKALIQIRRPGFSVATQNVRTHTKAINQNTDSHRSTSTTLTSFLSLVGHLNLLLQWFNSNPEPLW